MCNIDGNEEQSRNAIIVRDQIIDCAMNISTNTIKHDFTKSECNNILCKVMELVEVETRYRFWLNLECAVSNSSNLAKIWYRWAGRISNKPIIEKVKKAGYAKNGRVVRSD